ncbi:DUF2147 domain-containing protein [Bradyrhizobium archetypum]|uniref:DUF2147 domain-containing protein n=1 Tax=Bradyrhizobium archetypum TaxID=2721160 RepID=A0A7Y4H4B3_9BRAD|nr:DUF2147 domain-containing protein [Bradyrhizobium archetypum]NOJ47421.1 DUF2147 domain-containing protein [Bradyrhizobium archetypum]
MKKLYIVAALLMATTSANAGGITFQINGERIRVESPRNCNALSCIKITAPGYNGTLGNVDLKGMGSKSKDDDDSVATAPAKPATPGPAQAAAPQPAAAPAPAPTTTAAATPAQTEAAPPPPPPPAPLAAAPAPAPQPARAAAAAPASDPNSPLGVWATEENKGNVRIEECGANLCGYSVNSGERILINMKPQGGKWTGRIHDPTTGRNYDSTIALKGSDTLKVQGCAFGGMFCGGQTWKRVS